MWPGGPCGACTHTCAFQPTGQPRRALQRGHLCLQGRGRRARGQGQRPADSRQDHRGTWTWASGSAAHAARLRRLRDVLGRVTPRGAECGAAPRRVVAAHAGPRACCQCWSQAVSGRTSRDPLGPGLWRVRLRRLLPVGQAACPGPAGEGWCAGCLCVIPTRQLRVLTCHFRLSVWQACLLCCWGGGDPREEPWCHRSSVWLREDAPLAPPRWAPVATLDPRMFCWGFWLFPLLCRGANM